MNLKTDQPDNRWGFHPWAIHLLYKLCEHPGQVGELPDYAPLDYVLVLQGRGLMDCMGSELRGSLGRIHRWFKITPLGLQYLKDNEEKCAEQQAFLNNLMGVA